MSDEILKISVDSLKPAIYEGWGKKQGGSVKTWKKRWFVLKETKLWYFENKTSKEAKGLIELPPGTEIRDVSQNKKFMFSINSRNTKGARVFYIITENATDHSAFFDAVKKVLTKNMSSSSNNGSSGIQLQTSTEAPKEVEKQEIKVETPRNEVKNEENETKIETPRNEVKNEENETKNEMKKSEEGRENVMKMKTKISWLQIEGENVVEFWKFWMDSTPQRETLEHGQTIEYNLVVSGNTDKLSWRVWGSQGALIQNMVDFFWNVGAPDEEIDHLNDLGCQINPSDIGSWIDMSVMNGMDGGWFFKGELVVDVIKDCCDPCPHADTLINWAKGKGLNYICQMGRDMGATPPRQSEFRFKLDGTLESRMEKVLSAFQTFGFPQIEQGVLNAMNGLPSGDGYFYLCVIVSTDGFVKISVLIPQPQQTVVDSMLNAIGDVKSNHLDLHKDIAQSLGSSPVFVEYCHLNPGYGYEVYKEGPDVLVHYNLGTESK